MVHWSVQRSNLRLHIAVPVRLEGHCDDGTSFECEAWTLNVSAAGAAFQIPDGVALPGRIHVRSDDYQFIADAEVTVVWERTRPQRSIGVRVAPDTPQRAWQAR